MSSLIFPKNSNQAKRLARAVSNGELKRIRRGIYTDADWDEIPLLLSNQWHAVVAYLYPGAIVSYSSA
ncbi:MAG: type IV toxin-antitoxin system AbiEi family antitoxin domain-containing protein, partial [Gammaproteobacteria bacterium]|nr:type IV toxin-antitoxin system AbiEi family antitoxin domain-containing protein [Gammaproteobacteria bacterium]